MRDQNPSPIFVTGDRIHVPPSTTAAGLTDNELRRIARTPETGETLNLNVLCGLLPGFLGELIAMRAADPRTKRRLPPDHVDDEKLRWWADCFLVNPAYCVSDKDATDLALVLPAAAAELLAYRMLITNERSKKGDALKRALARRARRIGLFKTETAA